MSASDKIKHAAEDLSGKAKEATGTVTGDQATKAEGQNEQSKASAKKAGDNVKDIFK